MTPKWEAWGTPKSRHFVHISGPCPHDSSGEANGTKINDILETVNKVRKLNNEIPIILMGYYNSIFNLGIEEFTSKCVQVGVDGLIIVDLQPEEDADLYVKSNELQRTL